MMKRSTTVPVVVALLVIAALTATHFNSSSNAPVPYLKGSRKLAILLGGIGSSTGTATGSGEVNNLMGDGSAQGYSSFDSSGTSSAFMVGPGGVSAFGNSNWGNSGSQDGIANAAGLGGTSTFDGTTTGTVNAGFLGGVTNTGGVFGGGGSTGSLGINSNALGTAGFGTASGTSTGAGSLSGDGMGFGSYNGITTGGFGSGSLSGNGVGTGNSMMGGDFTGTGLVTGANFNNMGFGWGTP